MMRRPLASCLLPGLPALAQAADAPAVSAAGSLLQVFIGLVAVLLLIAATAWVGKRFGIARGGSSGLLQVIGSASVGARERVVVVEVGESWLVGGRRPRQRQCPDDAAERHAAAAVPLHSRRAVCRASATAARKPPIRG